MDVNKKTGLRINFYIWSILGILIGIGFAAFYIAYFKGGDFQDKFLDITNQLDETILFLMAVGIIVIQFLMAVLAYLSSFNKKSLGRAKPPLYFILLGLSIHIGGIYLAINAEGSFTKYPIITAISIGIVVLSPFFIYVIEFILKSYFTSFGILFFNRNVKKTALSFLTKGIMFSPQRDDLKEKKAILLFESGKESEADELFSEFDSKQKLSPELLKTAVASFLKRNIYEKAIYCLRKLLLIYPEDKSLKKILSESLIQIGEIKEAVNILEEIGDFSNSDFLNKMMSLYLKSDDVQKSLDICKKLAEIEGKPFKNSITAIKDILQKFPNHIDILKELIRLETLNNDVENSSKHLEQLLKLLPEDVDIRKKLIELYKNTLQYGKLSIHLDWLLKNVEETPDALYDYGEALINLKRDADAQRIFEKGKKLFPQDYRFAYRLAEQYLDQMHYVQAIEEISYSLEIAPANVKNSLSILKNKIYNKYKDLKIEELKKMSDENPSCLDSRSILVDSLVQHGFIERAAAEIDNFLSINPNEIDGIINLLEELVKKSDNNYLLLNYLADLYFKQGNFDKTIEHYIILSKRSFKPDLLLKEICEKIINISPNFIPAHKELANIAEKEGNFEKLASHLEIILQNLVEPDFALVQKLFDLYYGLGNTEKSFLLCQSLIKNDPSNLLNQKKMVLLLKERNELDNALEKIQSLRSIHQNDFELEDLEYEIIKEIKKRRMEQIKALIKEKGDDPALYEEYGDLAFFFNSLNEAILHYQKSAKCSQIPDLPKAKLGLALARKKMFELSDETLSEIKLTTNPNIHHEDYMKLLGYIYETALLFEADGHRENAVKIYKEIFRVDAGYKDVVDKIEKLSY